MNTRFNGVPTDPPEGISSFSVSTLYVLRDGQPINLSDTGVSFLSVSGAGQFVAMLDRTALTTETGQPFEQQNGDVFIFVEATEIAPGQNTFGQNQRAVIETDIADIQQQLTDLSTPVIQPDPSEVAKDVVFGEVGNEQIGTLECATETTIPSGTGSVELKGIPAIELIGRPILPETNSYGFISNQELSSALNDSIDGVLTDEQTMTVMSFLPGIISAIIGVLGYDPRFCEGRVEYYPRHEERMQDEYLLIEHLPIRKIAINVDEMSRFGRPLTGHSGDDLVDGVDYFMERDAGKDSQFSCIGHVIRNNQDWEICTGTIRVTYDSGYTDDELNGVADTGLDASGIKIAVLTQFRTLLKQLTGQTSLTGKTSTAPIASEKAGDYSVTFHGETLARLQSGKINLTAEVLGHLEPFVSYNQLGL